MVTTVDWVRKEERGEVCYHAGCGRRGSEGAVALKIRRNLKKEESELRSQKVTNILPDGTRGISDTPT